MNQGKVIAIYEDPITMKKLEGYAVLEKQLDNRGDDNTEYWTVKFVDGGERVERWIKTKGRLLEIEPSLMNDLDK